MRCASEFFLTAWAAFLRALLAGIIRTLPYRLWRPLLRASLRIQLPSARPDVGVIDSVISCVSRTDRMVPLGRCLERSLTAWLLLRRHVPCRVRLGVAWKSRGDPFAHACLEVDGRIVFGQPVADLALLEVEPGERGVSP